VCVCSSSGVPGSIIIISTLVLGAFRQVFFNANALPRINIGADVWGESDIITSVVNADTRLLCTSDGVCVLVYV
jgi:hypothetical protein